MADWTLSTVMDGIAAYAVAQGVASRAYGFPIPNPTPPCMVVGYPPGKFNFTFVKGGTAGAAELTFPLMFLASKVIDKAARDDLSAILTGATGVKDVMDKMTGSGVSYADVDSWKIEAINIGGVDWLAVVFQYDVVVS